MQFALILLRGASWIPMNSNGYKAHFDFMIHRRTLALHCASKRSFHHDTFLANPPENRAPCSRSRASSTSSSRSEGLTARQWRKCRLISATNPRFNRSHDSRVPERCSRVTCALYSPVSGFEGRTMVSCWETARSKGRSQIVERMVGTATGLPCKSGEDSTATAGSTAKKFPPPPSP